MDSRLRICVVSPLYHRGHGGVGGQARALTEKLQSLGCRSMVITRRLPENDQVQPGDIVPVYSVPTVFSKVHNLEELNIRNLLVSLSFCVGLAVVLVGKRRDYDLVHFHGASLPLITNLLILKLLRKKIIAKVVVTNSGVEPSS